MKPTAQLTLRPDPSRVIAKFFIPGLEDVGATGSRAGSVIDRVLLVEERDIESTLATVVDQFKGRHADLLSLFDAHADKIVSLINGSVDLTPARRRLLGAAFTHEYAIEGACVSNPSIVLHPEQSADRGGARFIMSVRGIGEGHCSSIGFRTGFVTDTGALSLDTPSPYARTAMGTAGLHHRSAFHERLVDLGHDFEDVSRFLSLVPPTFDDEQLAHALDQLRTDVEQRMTSSFMADVHDLSQWSYEVSFPDDTEISEMVLWPHAPPEYHGMEDARFVQFTHDDGDITYFGTYTAFDRQTTSVQLLETRDFRTFASSPVVGPAAVGKGLALFPRKVGGRYFALTRSDRQTNGVASTTDLRHWENETVIHAAHLPWELLQVGNCGSPLETPEGWLVLTHGVGPMRTYSIGALLLDLDDPTRVIAHTPEPLITPDIAIRDGYVPNVVYSCGAIIHNDHLVLPYGVTDQWIVMSTFRMQDVMSAFTSH